MVGRSISLKQEQKSSSTYRGVQCGEEENVSATMDPVRTDGGGVAADPWQGFTGSGWQDGIEVRDFIQANVTPYTGDAAFLACRPSAPVSCGRG